MGLVTMVRRSVTPVIAGVALVGLLCIASTPVGASSAKVSKARGALTPHAATTVTGYDLVGSDGGVFVFPTSSSSGYYGSLPGLGIHVNNIVGIVPSPDYRGYLLVGSDGGVFAFGDARYYGSLPGLGVKPAQRIVGIVPTSGGGGYFLVGKDGGVYAFGDAQFEGSLPGSAVITTDVTSIASTPDDKGYWVLLGSGQVYNFGDAPNLVNAPDSLGPLSNNQPHSTYVHVTSTTDGQGYWVLDTLGLVWTYGDANPFGDASSQAQDGEVPVSLVGTSDSQGYWIVTSNGDVVADGDASPFGTLPLLGVSVSNIVGAVPT